MEKTGLKIEERNIFLLSFRNQRQSYVTNPYLFDEACLRHTTAADRTPYGDTLIDVGPAPRARPDRER